MPCDALTSLGWDADLAAGFAALGRPDLQPWRVAAVHRGFVLLRGAAPDRLAPVAGALHHRGSSPVVGDWVAAPGDGAVEGLLPRRGVLARADDVLAAHVDLALVATSANADLDLRRTERFLAIAAGGDVPALVLLTKADLADAPSDEAARLAEALGVEVMALSTRDGRGVPELLQRLRPARTAALLGSSGVGKSTLVNALLGEERQATLPVREHDDRGRHATSHRELFALPGGALLLDAPGLRAPSLADGDGVEDTFADVEELAARCRFADCAHGAEPGCAVQAAIATGQLDPARLAARDKLAAEARRQEERTDGLGGAARRARDRAAQRAYQRAQGRR